MTMITVVTTHASETEHVEWQLKREVVHPYSIGGLMPICYKEVSMETQRIY